jgi:hypothetical protein
VAFGLAHLREHLHREPDLRARLMDAVDRRHDALRHAAGLNAEVFDALLLMAAGEIRTMRRGNQRVAALLRDMDEARRMRLARLGFDEREAAEISALQTRNFM